MQRGVASNRHVLVKQHVSHRNQSCFDLSDRLRRSQSTSENEFTFGDHRVALMLSSSTSASTALSLSLSLSMKLSFKLSLSFQTLKGLLHLC